MNKFLLVTLITVSASAAFATKYTGTYSVPVPNELKAFAEFPMKNIQVKMRNGTPSSISYDLPAEVNGHVDRVKLERKGLPDASGRIKFSSVSYGADSSCLKNVCDIQYDGLFIDESARDTLLQKISKSPEELAARREVAKLFSGDPAGTLIIKKRKKF